MKLLRYLLLALPLLSFTACNSDGDEMPELTMYADMYGFYYSEKNAAIYVLPDDYIVIKSLKVEANGNTPCVINHAAIFVNGTAFSATSTPPFSSTIPTNEFSQGSNVLTINTLVQIPGYDLTQMTAGYEINFVTTAAELPNDAVYYSATDDKEEVQ